MGKEVRESRAFVVPSFSLPPSERRATTPCPKMPPLQFNNNFDSQSIGISFAIHFNP